MRIIQKTDPKNGQSPEEKDQQSINPYPDETNIADGGEFLDDSLRMREQPLEETNIENGEQTKSQNQKSTYYEMY